MAAAFSMKEKPVTFESLMINIMQRIAQSRGLTMESICKTVKKSLNKCQIQLCSVWWIKEEDSRVS